MLRRLNWGKNQYFLIAIIDLQVKLLPKFSLNIIKYHRFARKLLEILMLGVENWWTGDVNSNPGKELDALISTAGYTQLIDKPTDFFSGGSSCIGFVFCNKPEIVNAESTIQTCHYF